MSVTTCDIIKELKLMETNFTDKINKLNKYYITKLVDLEKEQKIIVAESKMLKNQFDHLNKKYDEVCEEVNGTKYELNILKDLINKSNSNFSSNEDTVEKINDEDETKTILYTNTINKILNQHKVCDDVITVKKELNELKQHNICDDIVITGIPETKHENLLEIVNRVLVQYAIEIKSVDVKSIYRLKNMKCGLNSPILLVLKNENVKCLIMRKQKTNGPIILQSMETTSLNDLQKVFFKHRLTTENLSLLRNVRKFCRENCYQFVWLTNDAKILVKKNSETRPIKISSLKDLELLKTYNC